MLASTHPYKESGLSLVKASAQFPKMAAFTFDRDYQEIATPRPACLVIVLTVNRHGIQGVVILMTAYRAVKIEQGLISPTAFSL